MENNTIWMPKREYDEWIKLKDSMTIEAKNRMNYFFWNNFSFEGYKERKLKQKENGK